MQDELRIFAVEMWTINGSRERVIARSSHLGVARAAPEATIDEYPGPRMTLSQGAMIIDGTEKRERERGLRRNV